MLQDFVQVDLLGAGVRKRCAPPFVHVAPPTRLYPTPACTPSPFSCTLEHTGSLIFAPLLHSRTALFAQIAPRPVCTPFVPLPFASWVAPPIALCPSPCTRSPCVRPSTDAWPHHVQSPCVRPSPDTWPPLHAPPIAHTPIPPALPVCA